MTRLGARKSQARAGGRGATGSILRYLVAGGVAFAIDFGLLTLAHVVFGWPTWLAAGTAFVVSFIFTYTIQRVFSFGSLTAHGPALIKYTLLVALNTVVTSIIVALADGSALSWIGGKVLATAMTTVWNYFAYRYWIFPDASRRDVVAKTIVGED